MTNNSAATLARAIPDQDAAFGQRFSFTVPEGTFSDADASPTHSYSATLLGGDPLPDWLSFDPATRTFSGIAPASETGFDVTVTLTDTGLNDAGSTVTSTVRDTFRLDVGPFDHAPTFDAPSTMEAGRVMSGLGTGTLKVDGVGDVDGDGIGDIVVGAPNSGRATIVSGADGSTIRTVYGSSTDRFGSSVAGVGDVNGDGVDDFAVGARLDDVGSGFYSRYDRGSVTVYSGADGSTIRTVNGEFRRDYFGTSLDNAGDVDGDGIDDMIVGVSGHDPYLTAGCVYDYGMARIVSGADGSTIREIDGDSSYDRLGEAVAGAGDFNGDGYADVIVGVRYDDNTAYDSGSARVVSGLDGEVLATFNGENRYDYFGWSVAAAGDVNNDGYADVVVGAPNDDDAGTDAGSALVISGYDGNVLHKFTGRDAFDYFGRSVAGAGDVDGDGYDDIAVASPLADRSTADVGTVEIYSGRDGTLLHNFDGTSRGQQFGTTLSNAGDLNGDGIDDLVVGSADGTAQIITSVRGEGTLGGTVAHVEGGAASVLDADARVRDVELDGANNARGNYADATLTLVRAGGASGEDVFSGTGGLALADGNVILDNAVVGIFTQGEGELAITFNATATSAAVDRVMQSIAYSNTSDTPPASVAIEFAFSDGTSGTPATGSVTVAITATNDAPVLELALLDQLFDEDTAFSYQIEEGSFTDVDNDALTLAATLADGTALPDWIAFDAATRTFSGTPPTDFNGTVSVTVTASDGEASVSDTFDIVIAEIADAPRLVAPLPDQSFMEDPEEGFFFMGVPEGTFEDPDTPVLSYSATLADGSALPDWMGYSEELRVFAVNAPENYNGTLSLLLTATDGEFSVSDRFELTIEAVNDAPVLGRAIGDSVNAEDTPILFSLPEATFVDVDGDELVVTAQMVEAITNEDGTPGETLSDLPEWLTFDPAARAFSGTPPENYSGALDVRVTASDGTVSVSDDFNLAVVAVNDAPILTAPLQTLTSDEDTPLDVSLPEGAFTDVEGQALTLSATLADGEPLPEWMSFDPATGRFTGTPPADYAGTIPVTVTASDGEATTSDTFDIVIAQVDDAPVLNAPLADQSVDEDDETGVSVFMPVETFIDIDGEALALSVAMADGSELPDWLDYSVETRTLSGVAPTDFNGQMMLTVTATDDKSTVSDDFMLTVNAVNDAPTVGEVADVSGVEDEAFSTVLPDGLAGDVDGDAVVLSVAMADGAAVPAWLAFDAATRTLSGTPPADFNGELALALVGSDGTASASAPFTLAIEARADAPVLAREIGDQVFDEDSPVAFTLPRNAFTDADGDDLALSARLADGSALPGWLRFDRETGEFSGTPPQDYNGEIAISVRASDGSASASDTFTLTIVPQNDRPTPAEDVVAANGTVPLNIATAFLLSNDRDEEGQALTLTGVGGSADGRVSLRGDQVIFEADAGFAGRTSFTYLATDGEAPYTGRVSVIVYPDDDGDGDRLFDTAWYLDTYRDVAAAGIDARAHYEAFGWREGRDPNALFDSSAYLAVNKDVAAAGMNPLDHFRLAGHDEGRDASFGFDTHLYLRANPDIAAAGLNALEHYLHAGRYEGREAYDAIGRDIAADGFDAQYYLFANPDIAAAGVDARAHYDAFGRAEGRAPNALFDPAFYLARNEDVAAAGIDPLAHYHLSGWREGRDPSARFDTSDYTDANGMDLGGRDPVSHYLANVQLPGGGDLDLLG